MPAFSGASSASTSTRRSLISSPIPPTLRVAPDGPLIAPFSAGHPNTTRLAAELGGRRPRAAQTIWLRNASTNRSDQGNHIQVSIINLSHRGPKMPTTIATMPVATIDSDNR